MSARGWLLLFVVGAAVHPGCACGPNGHIEQQPFVAVPGDDVVNCNCNLSFLNEHCPDGICLIHIDLQLCLPPELQNVDLGGVVFDGGADMGPDDYSRSVDHYCRDSATNAVYHVIKVFNGDWCRIKDPFAPDGGIGQSVECFAQQLQDGKLAATGRDDGTCEKPCDRVACDYDTNCGKDITDDQGGLHFDRCKCSQVTKYQCPGDPMSILPTDLFCRPPDNSVH